MANLTPKYGLTGAKSSLSSPTDGTSVANTQREESVDLSRSVFCDNCSLFLVPDSVDVASGILDEDARQICTDYFKELAQQGVRVTSSKTMLERGIELGCSMCEIFQRESRRGTSHSGTDELPPQPSDLDFLIYTAIHPVSANLDRATDVGELRLATVPPAPAGLIARFRLFAQDSSISAKYISSRPTYDVDRTLHLAREMMDRCNKYHSPCRWLRGRKRTRFPKRLIKISGNLKGNLQVVPTDGLCVSYTALSYCWGANQPIALNSETKETLRGGIPITMLPQTIREAIYVTERLNLEYLWVDALCILQDDPDEIAEEVAAIDEIYGEAEIIIAATRSAAATQSFLCPLKTDNSGDEPYQKPLRLLYLCITDNQIATIYAEKFALTSGWREPLNNRAWTFQETSLARRSLSFYLSQTFWNCPNSEEDLGLGDAPTWIPRRDGNDLDNLTLELGKRGGTSEDLYTYWQELLIKYTRRGLSYETDRLPAFAGIAKRFDMALSDDYLAGIWAKMVPKALAWMCVNSGEEPEVLRASWSWASSGSERSRVVFPSYKSEPLDEAVPTRLVGYDIKPLNASSPFSNVENAILKLRAKVGWVEWDGCREVILDSKKPEKVKVTLIPDWHTKHLRTADGGPVGFRMGPLPGEKNLVTRRLNLVSITPSVALMLCEANERRERYYRVGLTMTPDLVCLSDGWEERIIEVE